MLYIDIFSLVLGYIFGSVPFGLLAGYICGVGDIRKLGSGNIGATNVLRSIGKFPAFCVLLCDSGKGALAVFLYDFIVGGGGGVGGGFSIWVGLMAILGHSYSVWLGFRGGKGVATSFGVLLVLDIFIFLGVGFIWVLTFVIFRISSLAALLSFVALPIWVLLLGGSEGLFWGGLLLSVFVIFRHWENIQRLLQGTEKKMF